MELRVEEDGSWSSWMAVEELRDAPTDAPLPAGQAVSEPMFFDNATRLQYRIVDAAADAPAERFSDAVFTYIDSRTNRRALSWVGRLLRSFTALADGGTPVISRSDWGADESYRLTSSGSQLWPPTYAPVEKIIIHHTAGSNGGSDSAAVVRGIYYFHAVVNGWGDIGYNYLVDPAGKIYEGRYGGDGVVGGHTYNDQEKVDYNRGTIGIALLGNFQGDVLTDAARSTITSLAAEKGRLFGLAPAGTGTFRGRINLPNIVGHRDVDATTCPGANLYAELDPLRNTAQTAFDALPPLPTPELSATAVTPSPLRMSIKVGETFSAQLQFMNTSNVPWQSYILSHRVTLRPVAAGSKLAAASWLAAAKVATSDMANVAIGETGTFTLPLLAPADALTVDEDFALFREDGMEVANTRVHVTVDVLSLPYAATIEALPIPPAVFVQDTRTIAVTIKNGGTEAWKPDEMVLRVYDVNYQPSVFRASGWPDPTAGIPVREAVEPGATVTLQLPLRTPIRPGTYVNIVRVQRSDGGTIASDERSMLTRADSRWQAGFLSTSLPLAVRRTWRPTLVVKFKNTGLTTWNRKLQLRVYDAGFKRSPFAAPSWTGTYGNATLKEREVKPGETGTFVLRLKPPSVPGLYRQILRLELPGTSTQVQNGMAHLLTRVD